MKYVIFQDNSVILFSELDDHKKMAAGRPVKSAGFCSFETERDQFDDIRCANVTVWGFSMSLDVGRLPGDEDIIKNAIKFHLT